jgi:membrane associated rhomboid family serine protease
MAETATCYRHPDRETGLSCSECGRPICVDCMTVAPVGIRCPDHAGTASGTRKPNRPVSTASIPSRRSFAQDGTLVTKLLIGVNVAFYFIGVAQGGSINQPDGSLYRKFWLYGPWVANGDWWRLITSAFLHASLLHIVFNMLALWWIGGPLEAAIGRWRYLIIYAISGLAGAAGALLASPHAVTVGASGAIFGLLGAMLVIQWQQTGSIGGPALTLVLINLAITFAVPNISWGGHLGGLVGGVLATLAITHFGTRHVAYARISPAGAVALVVIMVGSVLIAYWRVRGMA